jgi:hypothetical protein
MLPSRSPPSALHEVAEPRASRRLPQFGQVVFVSPPILAPDAFSQRSDRHLADRRRLGSVSEPVQRQAAQFATREDWVGFGSWRGS